MIWEKAVEDSPSGLAHVFHMGDPEEAPVPWRQHVPALGIAAILESESVDEKPLSLFSSDVHFNKELHGKCN